MAEADTLRDGPISIAGVRALVRLMLFQADRDKAAGLNTGGFVWGDRGSPLGTAVAGARDPTAVAGVTAAVAPGRTGDFANNGDERPDGTLLARRLRERAGADRFVAHPRLTPSSLAEWTAAGVLEVRGYGHVKDAAGPGDPGAAAVHAAHNAAADIAVAYGAIQARKRRLA